MTPKTSLVRLRGRLASMIRTAPDAGPMCRAPFWSMYLDQRGDVRACCQNGGFAMGNVAESSLSEIWRGAKAARLRAAIAADDLSLGCNYCQWQLDAGSAHAVFARNFDHLPAEVSIVPEWPRQLELSMSNACNLQCVMCNGEWSSAIRANREKLPPLPRVYGDRFFEELAEFLPHLEVVKFLGGEPFLGAEPLRVMEMLAEATPDVVVHVTTNGTQWSPRIERILDRLPAHIAVSLDGVSEETCESIRVGSQYAAVMDNVERFAAYCRERGTSFSLSHCLMTVNWQEFDRFLDHAERLRCAVYVNTVTEPHDLSLYHLPPSELRDVLSELEHRSKATRRRLSGRRLEVWDDQLARLRGHLHDLERHDPPSYVAKRRHLGFAWLAPPDRSVAALAELDAVASSSTGWLVELDVEGRMRSSVELGPTSEPLVALVRQCSGTVPHRLTADPTVPDDGSVVGDDLHRYDLELAPAGVAPHFVPVTRAAIRDDEGVLRGVRVLLEEQAGA